MKCELILINDELTIFIKRSLITQNDIDAIVRFLSYSAQAACWEISDTKLNEIVQRHVLSKSTAYLGFSFYIDEYENTPVIRARAIKNEEMKKIRNTSTLF